MARLFGEDIARFLGHPLRGSSLEVQAPADLEECGPGSLVWVKSFRDDRLALLENRLPALAICDPETAARTTVPTMASPNPRLDFVRALYQYFTTEEPAAIHPTALIEPGATVGRDVSLGAYARVGAGVSIGDGCRIGSGVALEGAVELGRRCVVKANSVLGGQGFGFEYDDDGTPLHFPHVGRIVLEDDVWLGACTTVERATLGVTLLCAGVKVDDLVQVGHNVTVGRNTLIMANTVVCGGARIGEHCWIAPNSVIKEKVCVGDRVTVGLGAVVLKDVEEGSTVAGVPAKPMLRRT
ncbi:MAG: hypothetical protein HZB55_19715 [Deltaproteobacteria bacterium]|nr:hypothetical protein [Deltaproteobacteria bacterium]